MRNQSATPLDSLSLFATDLRALRRSAGKPSLHHISRSTGLHHSQLRRYFSGAQLPSERVLKRIVAACEGNIELWELRRSRLSVQLRPKNQSPQETRRLPRFGALILASLCLGAIAAATVSFSGMLFSRPNTASPPAASMHSSAFLPPAAQPPTPISEQLKTCHQDAQLLASGVRESDSFVQLFYSPSCRVVWGAVLRNDGHESGNALAVELRDDPQGTLRGERVLRDAATVMSPLTPTAHPAQRFCVFGALTKYGDSIRFSQPVCAAIGQPILAPQ